jgi:hypothetical protein
MKYLILNITKKKTLKIHILLKICPNEIIKI